jgi:hypothetical protein
MRYQDSIYLEHIGKAGAVAHLASRRARLTREALIAQTLKAMDITKPNKPAEPAEPAAPEHAKTADKSIKTDAAPHSH